MTFRRADPAKVAKGIELVDGGLSPEEAGPKVGVSGRTLRRALDERGPAAAKVASTANGKPAPAPPMALELEDGADPLEIMRALLKSQADRVRALPADSPRVGPATAEMRALGKSIALLSKQRDAVEQPDEAVARRRREDGETRREIERYVLQAEAEAELLGVCVHCGQPVSR